MEALGFFYPSAFGMVMEFPEEERAGDEDNPHPWLRRVERATKRASKRIESITGTATTLHRHLYTVANLQRLVAEHPDSVTAKYLLEIAIHAQRGRKAINKGCLPEGAAAWAKAIRMNPRVAHAHFMNNNVRATRKGMEVLYSDTKQCSKTRAEALFVNGFLLFKFWKDPEQALKKIRLAHILLPNDPGFHSVEAFVLALSHQPEAAVLAFERAEKLGCKVQELTLLEKGFAMTVTQAVPPNIPLCWIQYVNQAERDAEMLPELCYQIAWHLGCRGPSSLGLAKHYQLMGEEADKRRLPALPDLSPYNRIAATTLLKRFHLCASPLCLAVGFDICTGCHEVYYCGSKCQKTHWPLHKAICKKARKDKKNQKGA